MQALQTDEKQAVIDLGPDLETEQDSLLTAFRDEQGCRMIGLFRKINTRQVALHDDRVDLLRESNQIW